MIKKIYRGIQDFLPNSIVISIGYLRSHKSLPNLISPKGFNEKINIVKLGKWLESKSDFVDKYKVRFYIENKIGDQYLPKLYNVYNAGSEINFEALPDSFVLKLNNGCGCNLIVKDKSSLVEEEVRTTVDMWIKSDFYKKTREKQYKNVEQVVIVEEYLEDNSGDLRDYKFFVFNGKVKFVQVDTGRNNKHFQTFYDNRWNKLDFTYVCEKTDIVEEKPDKLSEMIFLAEKLGSEFPFVRVDFYYTNDKIYFGELTFTPNNGGVKFKPEEKELEFGSWIDLDKYK